MAAGAMVAGAMVLGAGPGRAGASVTRSAIRVVALVMAAAYIYLAVATGLDQAADDRPDLAGLVPDMLAAQALDGPAGAAMARKDGKGLEAVARQALAHRPIEGSSTAYYGLAKLMQGDAAASDAAFRVAAGAGWREVITQVYWLNQALAQQDYALAAMRLDAVLRQRPVMVAQREIIEPFERNPASWPALIDRMALKPGWVHNYAADIAGLSPEQLARRLAIFDQRAKRGLRLGCDEATAITNHLADQGERVEARAFWGSQCDDSADGVVMDGHLRRRETPGVPPSRFRWDVQSDGDLRVDWGGDSRSGTIAASNGSEFPMQLVRQMVVAPKGRYELIWRAVGADGRPSDRIFPQLGCSSQDGDAAQGTHLAGDGNWHAQVVIDGQCNGGWLQFVIKPDGQLAKPGPVILGPVAMYSLEQASSR